MKTQTASGSWCLARSALSPPEDNSEHGAQAAVLDTLLAVSTSL